MPKCKTSVGSNGKPIDKCVVCSSALNITGHMLSCVAAFNLLDPLAHGGAAPSGREPAEVTPGLGPGDALGFLTQRSTITLDQAKRAHARALRSGLSRDPALLPSLLRLYSSNGRLDLASRLLAASRDPPTIAWNLLIHALASDGAPYDALLLYNRMLGGGVRPDKFTFPFALKACSVLADAGKGQEIHAFAIKSGFARDSFLQNSLVHFYFRCSQPDCARKVFDRMPVRSVVSWTAMLSGLLSCGEMEDARAVFKAMPIRNVVSWTAMIDSSARSERPDEAFALFRRMQEDGVRPNEFTIISLLIACAELGSLRLGRWVHEFARKNGELDESVYVGTALVDMYSKCGSLEDARRVFDRMQVRSLATWNSMITSLGVHGQGKDALALFMRMEKVKLQPDGITFVGVLSACVKERLVAEGFRFFQAMIEHYGIEPCHEHFECLVQLLDCAANSNSAEVRAIMKDLILKLDAGGLKLMKLERDDGDSRVQRFVNCCIDECDAAMTKFFMA